MIQLDAASPVRSTRKWSARTRMIMAETLPETIIDKLWNAHAITTREDGQTLLFIDRHILHEGSFHAFDQLRHRGATVARPDLTFGIADHYVPTRPASSLANPEAAGMIEQLDRNARDYGFLAFGQF